MVSADNFSGGGWSKFVSSGGFWGHNLNLNVQQILCLQRTKQAGRGKLIGPPASAGGGLGLAQGTWIYCPEGFGSGLGGFLDVVWSSGAGSTGAV